METCSTPPTPAVTGGGLEWGVGERGEVENVRGRREEKMGAELSCKLRESSCVCRCRCVIVWGRNRDNSYHLLGSLSFGFITPKIEQLTNSPTHPSPNLLHPPIFPILGNRTTICPLPQDTEANSSAFSSNCPLNLTGSPPPMPPSPHRSRHYRPSTRAPRLHSSSVESSLPTAAGGIF